MRPTSQPALHGAEAASLEAAIGQLHLEGAIFFRAEFTEAWAFESPGSAVAGYIREGAERLMFFHIVGQGRCWIEAGGGPRHWADAGDVIVLPYGDRHRVGGVRPAPAAPLDTLVDPLPWATPPVLRYGSGGPRTDIVCGYLHSTDPLLDPRLAAFPSAFVVRPHGPLASWVRSSIEYALAVTSENAPAGPMATRLPALVVGEVLRAHIAAAPSGQHGWIAAVRDPILGPALAALHGAPERKWTVAELASEAAASRSLLDARFREVLGLSPIRYLAG